MFAKRFLLSNALFLALVACSEPPIGNQVQVNVVIPPTPAPKAAPHATAPAAAVEPTQQTLSVLRIVDGSGCPTRDPKSFGVFLKSERQGSTLLCYYD